MGSTEQGAASEPGTSRPPLERVAQDLDELVEVLGHRNLESLREELYNDFDEPDVYMIIDDFDGAAVVLGEGDAGGYEVPFPITASEFWELVRQVQIDNRALAAYEWIALLISVEEGLEVSVTGPEPAYGEPWSYPENTHDYPYAELAPGGMTARQWIDERFAPAYPGLEVEFLELGSDETLSTVTLEVLRARYEAAC